eukprot:gene2002-1509_t
MELYQQYASYFPGLDKERNIRLHAEDLFIVLGSCIFFFILRKFLNMAIYIPFANYLQLDKTKGKKNKGSKYSRFIEDIWYSTFYPVSTLIMFLIIRREDWFWDPYLSVKGYGLDPHPHLGDDITFLRYFYLLQFGYYLQLLVNLLFIDEKLADFYEMLAHHLITKSLIAFSYIGVFHRIGANIIILHDFVDIFLYWAKTCHDADWQMLANFNFFAFVTSLPIVRLYFLGRYLILPIPGEPLLRDFDLYMKRDLTTPFFSVGKYICAGEHCISSSHIAFTLLCGLWCLHVNWFIRAIGVLVQTLKNSGNVTGDNRYKDGEEEKQKNNKQKKK